MVTNYIDLSAQRVYRLDIQHEYKEPGKEFTEVWGEIECTSPALVYARDLRLKSIENILFTADTIGAGNYVHVNVTKWVYNKGQKNNRASIFIYNIAGGGGAGEVTSGSIYLNFLAMGE